MKRPPAISMTTNLMKGNSRMSHSNNLNCPHLKESWRGAHHHARAPAAACLFTVMWISSGSGAWYSAHKDQLLQNLWTCVWEWCSCEMTRRFKWSSKPPDLVTEPFKQPTAKYHKTSVCLQMDRDRKKCLCAKRNQCKIAVLFRSEVDPCCYKPCSSLCLNRCLFF